MSGHTAGPWALGKPYGLHGVEVVGDDGNRMICGVIGVERDTHAKDGRTTGTIATRDGWANARLIAAAPDSHEANRLSFVVLCAVRAAGVFAHDTNLRKEVDTAIEANRAAIAKATGASE